MPTSALVPKTNTFYVRARNETGMTHSREVVVSFTRPPVRVFLDQLEPLRGGKAVPITALADGLITTKAPQGSLMLHGRVVWTDPTNPGLKSVERINVLVNSVLQVDPVRLEPPVADKPLERGFQVRVFLSKEEGNRLEVQVPDQPLEDADRRVYVMSCVKPVVEKKMLHFLIIGIGEKDRDAFRKQIFEKLGMRSINDVEFAWGDYNECYLYGPLVNDRRPVETIDVSRQFRTMRKRMDARARNDFFTHYVMCYCKGTEVDTPWG